VVLLALLMAGTVDGTLADNGPTEVTLSSANAVVKSAKTDKEKKTKKEKPKVVGIFELVRLISVFRSFVVLVSQITVMYLRWPT